MLTTLPNRTRTLGFTLIEALVALLFVAVVLPVIVNAFLTANRMGVVAERARVAAELADRKLTELMITEEWRDGVDSGDFGEAYDAYQWQVTREDWSEDTMQRVTVSVSFHVQGRAFSVSISTLAAEEES